MTLAPTVEPTAGHVAGVRHAQAEVLICGAGPTGLVLALRLARAGIRVRIVDAAPSHATSSRALVVQARTLEFYRQMGFADEFAQLGVRFAAINFWVRGRRASRAALGDLARGRSAFPYLLVVPQDEHERFLAEQLRRLGVEVERGTELLDFTADHDGVTARLRAADGVESDCRAAFLAGCDGARSRVRHRLGIEFAGTSSDHVFFVADVEASGPVMNDELHVALDDSDLLAVFPLRGGRTARFVGPVRRLGEQGDRPLGWSDVEQGVVQRLGVTVERVHWFSTYQVHHRVAESFRRGRVFLLGDAAHIHSPVGGQGMNTGVGDAVNLAWKLAEVLRGRAPLGLLNSYEPERIAFARRLVATTDRWFGLITSPGRLARFVRTRWVPIVTPLAFRFAAVRRFLFATISQTALRYRGGDLGAGRCGPVRAGDRLPWSDAGHGDNHAALDGLGWQVQVYGSARPELRLACCELALPLCELPWHQDHPAQGLRRDALYLLRPDGHVAWVDAAACPRRLARFVASVREHGNATGAGPAVAAFSPRAAGAWLIAAAAAFWLSWSLMPGVGITDTKAIFARVAVSPGAVRWSAVLQLASAACYAPALLGLVQAHRGRAVVVGAALLLAGAMGSAADAVLHLLAVAMVAPGVDQAAMVPVMQRMQGPDLALLLPMIGAFFAGTMVLAVTFARRRLVPRLLPLLFPLGMACAVTAGSVSAGHAGAARWLALAFLGCVAMIQVCIGAAQRRS